MQDSSFGTASGRLRGHGVGDIETQGLSKGRDLKEDFFHLTEEQGAWEMLCKLACPF